MRSTALRGETELPQLHDGGGANHVPDALVPTGPLALPYRMMNTWREAYSPECDISRSKPLEFARPARVGGWGGADPAFHERRGFIQ